MNASACPQECVGQRQSSNVRAVHRTTSVCDHRCARLAFCHVRLSPTTGSLALTGVPEFHESGWKGSGLSGQTIYTRCRPCSQTGRADSCIWIMSSPSAQRCNFHSGDKDCWRGNSLFRGEHCWMRFPNHFLHMCAFSFLSAPRPPPPPPHPHTHTRTHARTHIHFPHKRTVLTKT